MHIELLERVFLRMGAVETDEQLQQTVDKFLCPVINKLVSPFQSVRDKVSAKHFVNAHSFEKFPPVKVCT